LKKTRTKIILLAIVGMLALSITIVSARGWWRTFNLRHIDDWMANNPLGAARGWGGYDYEDNIFWLYTVRDYENNLHDFTYTGCVVEEVRPDGSLKYTVILRASNVYIEVYNGIEIDGNWFDDDLLGIGTMDYIFIIKFILDPWIPGGDTWWGPVEPGPRVAGCELPYLFALLLFPDVIGAQDLGGEIEGYGSIDLMEPGSYWYYPGYLDPPPTPTGETANVYLHQSWYYDWYGNMVWPNERIIIS
jgi:hypothetical protein